MSALNAVKAVLTIHMIERGTNVVPGANIIMLEGMEKKCSPGKMYP